MRTRRLAIVLASFLAYAAHGCGGSPAVVKNPRDEAAEAKRKEREAEEEAKALRYLAAHPIVKAEAGTFGPYLGRGKKGALSLWASPTERGHRWMSLALDANGSPTGSVHDAGAAPDRPPRVVIRAQADGYLAALSYETDFASTVATLALSPSGEPKAEPVSVKQSADPVLFADIVNLDGGAVLVYAKKRGGAAELWAIPIDEVGKARGKEQILVGEALGWQPISLGEFGALGLVLRGEGESAPSSLGRVAMLRFDENGEAISQLSLLNDEPTADPDLDMVRLGETVVLGWTDRRKIDAQAFIATTDLEGKAKLSPRPATPPRGEQALFALIGPAEGSPSDRALLAWEELNQQTSGHDLPAHARVVRLGLIGKNGMLGPRTATLALGSVGGVIPEFAQTKNGWAALTLAPACSKGSYCESGNLLPTAVRFDRDLAVIGSEPLTTEAFGPAAWAWSLSCQDEDCAALAATDAVPTPVFAVEIPARESEYFPAAKLDLTPKAPRAATWEAIVSGERLAGIASTKLGDSSLVAWATHFPELASDGKTSPDRAATIGVLALDERSEPKKEPTTISVRASSLGGISIAAHEGEACIAWAGHDSGNTQVFATRINREGERISQAMMTRAKGTVSDIAITWAKDGWVLAWVDHRDDKGEVFVTKVDKTLKRVIAEQRITKASAQATGLKVHTLGDDIWLAWADGRNGDTAEPYAVRLSAKTLKPRGEEARLSRVSDRAHSIELTSLDGDIVIGWIEGDESAKLVRLDGQGDPLTSPLPLRLEAPAGSFALSCDDERGCRGIVSAAAHAGELRLDAFGYDGQNGGRASEVLRLSGSAASEVAPSLLGDWVYFADDDLSGGGKLRRMRMIWR